MSRSSVRLSAIVALSTVFPAAAHEFWIEPVSPTPAPGASLTASMRVGQDFEGRTFPYLSNRFRSFLVHDASGTRPLKGLEGDDPAVTIRSIEPGLTIVTYQSTADTATFETVADFADYLAYEGLAHVADKHRAEGLPSTNFSEDYVRAAKALIQAGPVRTGDADRAVGLPAELVALGNPFEVGRTETPVQMLWQGVPVPDWQIAVFLRPADGTDVTRALYTTNAVGVVSVDTSRPGRYLLNAVHIERTDKSVGTVWKSHWASLTFAAGVD